MSYSRRKIIRLASSAAIAVLYGQNALAQAFPNRRIRIVLPYGPGSAADVVARSLGDELSQKWQQPVVIDNKPGASGLLTMQEVKRAKPDGYDLVLGDIGTLAINPSYFDKLGYDAVKDFEPIVDIFAAPFLIWVPKDAPYKNLTELVQAARSAPGKLTYASTGPGSPIFTGTELFKLQAGRLDIIEVPFKEIGPMITSVATGEVNFIFVSSATVKAVQGKLRPLAVSTRQRHPDYPDVPTVNEALGINDFSYSPWGALLAPKGTPADVIEKIRSGVISAMAQPGLKTRLNSFSLTGTTGMESKVLASFIADETSRYKPILQKVERR